MVEMWYLNIDNVTYVKNCEGSKILLLFQVVKLVAIVSKLIVDDMRLLGQRQRTLLDLLYVLISSPCPPNSWSDAQVNAPHTVSTLTPTESQVKKISIFPKVC